MTQEEILQLRSMMEEVVNPIKNEISDVKNRVTKIELTVENKIDYAIKLLLENHASLVEKNTSLDQKDMLLENRVEVLEHKVSDIEHNLNPTT